MCGNTIFISTDIENTVRCNTCGEEYKFAIVVDGVIKWMPEE